MIEGRIARLRVIGGQARVILSVSAASLTGLWIAPPVSAKAPTICLYSHTTSGYVRLGKQSVPIVNSITIQGGIEQDQETGAETFVAAQNGETLSKAPQNVPGGLSGLVQCLEIENISERRACETASRAPTGMTVITELARPARGNRD